MNKELNKRINKKLILVFTVVVLFYTGVVSFIDQEFSILPIVFGIIFSLLCITGFNILLKFIQKR